jgi:hypothetical protein
MTIARQYATTPAAKKGDSHARRKIPDHGLTVSHGKNKVFRVRVFDWTGPGVSGNIRTLFSNHA